jgi:hypothetical protein
VWVAAKLLVKPRGILDDDRGATPHDLSIGIFLTGGIKGDS